jgi:hypothetical protein
MGIAAQGEINGLIVASLGELARPANLAIDEHISNTIDSYNKVRMVGVFLNLFS